MSSTFISFKTKLRITDQFVPLKSEIVFGDSNSQDGVENGFLFKLDLEDGQFPPYFDLGAIIGFIEDSLGVGAGELQNNPSLGTILEEFPSIEDDGQGFNSQNTTQVEICDFQINSTTSSFLFSISINVVGSDPNMGLIALPDQLSGWLKINNIAMSFTSSTTSE